MGDRTDVISLRRDEDRVSMDEGVERSHSTEADLWEIRHKG